MANHNNAADDRRRVWLRGYYNILTNDDRNTNIDPGWLSRFNSGTGNLLVVFWLLCAVCVLCIQILRQFHHILSLPVVYVRRLRVGLHLTVADVARYEIDSEKFILKRFDNKMIRIFNHNNEIVDILVYPVLKRLRKLYKLNIDLMSKTKKSYRNTQTIGKEVIIELNKRNENSYRIRQNKVQENLISNKGNLDKKSSKKTTKYSRSIEKAKVDTKAEYHLNGEDYILRKYDNGFIRIFDMKNNMLEVTVLPILRSLIKVYQLNVSTDGNTQTIGSNVIDALNKLKK